MPLFYIYVLFYFMRRHLKVLEGVLKGAKFLPGQKIMEARSSDIVLHHFWSAIHFGAFPAFGAFVASGRWWYLWHSFQLL